MPPTATADADRRTLRCTPAALAAAVVLLDGPLTDALRSRASVELADLAAAGVTDGEGLVPWIAALLRDVVAPDLAARVSRQDPRDPADHTLVWARRDH